MVIDWQHMLIKLFYFSSTSKSESERGMKELKNSSVKEEEEK